ncbi:hypothetical protein [Nocardia sp. NBC_01377]|uniref:hypothetical protein n=1 Tax=Nocardia sp. NBC_01377 TaxID=2903595 RepID=UPI002F9120DF
MYARGPGPASDPRKSASELCSTDCLLPDLEQVLGFTAIDDSAVACRRLLELGAGLVAATIGGDGVLVAQGERRTCPPSPPQWWTPCRSVAFSARFLVGVAADRDPRQVAVLGCAIAALVAGGLASDHGEFVLAAADEFAAVTPVLATSYTPPR